MTATVIDGKAVAARVRKDVAREVAALPAQPTLATVLVGDDPASAIYVRHKRKQCADVGMLDLHRQLPSTISQHAAAAVIDELAADPQVTGILLQLPLPPHLNTAAVIERIPLARTWTDSPQGARAGSRSGCPACGRARPPAC